MKKIFLFTILLVSFSLFSQTGIGTTSPHASAALDVTSTTKGFLPPRMTSAQMNAIVSPATGLTVYCTDCTPASLYTYTGSAWETPGTSSSGSSSVGGVTASLAFTAGTYIWGASSSRTITITIVNQSFATIAWTTNVAADLVLTGNSGLTVGSPSASTSIAAGATGTIQFTITGAVGTMNNITATWSKLGLTVAGTKTVTGGSATFTDATNNAYVFSANASGVNVAGTLAIGTTVALPYTSGVGKYAAYTSTYIAIPSQFCNDGATDWTFAYSYPAGIFTASGNITATLITKKGGAITAWPAFKVTNIATINSDCVSAPLVVNGITLSNTVGIDEGGDAIRGQLTTRAAAYDAASQGTWVSISLAEYNLLAANVPSTLRRINNGINYAEAASTSGSVTVVPTNPAVSFLVPSSSYIFAISLKVAAAGTNNKFANAVVRFNSSTPDGTFTSLGTNSLTAHHENVAGGQIYAWVIKRPTQITTSPAGFGTYVSLNVYSNLDNLLLFGNGTASYESLSKSGSAASMSGATVVSGFTPAIQVLSTTIKSW